MVDLLKRIPVEIFGRFPRITTREISGRITENITGRNPEILGKLSE